MPFIPHCEVKVPVVAFSDVPINSPTVFSEVQTIDPQTKRAFRRRFRSIPDGLPGPPRTSETTLRGLRSPRKPS